MTQAHHPLSLDFFLRLSHAQALLAARLDDRLGTLHGISCGDFQLLTQLGRAPGARLRRSELAERVALSPAGVTRMLQPLEKIGLVARQPDPHDARLGYAALTPAGRAMLPAATETAHMICQRALHTAPPEQLGAFAAMLGQLAGMPAPVV
ncbi:MarR family winged helix-turn-helix transcriptional regulator [Janthinobacterium fluminis]|uniref:MarR family transcriptional regulator n=1 Tax=Janthinobacterium fluminis TaxID=2987524 RepID=A0ABT5K745_9BURK|nr:MarR family transcriptional regulator [Janthinobacterium fluminis]MDC8760724.1 MarR family transcriptional regulator [Janthinobacterium fluminis]